MNVQVNFDSLGGGGTKPVELWKDASGSQSFTIPNWGAVQYDYLLIVSQYGQNAEHGLTLAHCSGKMSSGGRILLSPQGGDFSATSSWSYQTIDISSSGVVSTPFKDTATNLVVAIYGIVGDSFDVSDIISEWSL